MVKIKKMLTKDEIILIAKNYLLKNEHPVESFFKIVFPDDEQKQESKRFLKENNFARVVFSSYIEENNPYKDLIPSIFIVYVNYYTGEVFMPRHM